MDAAAVVGYIILNIAILFGIWLGGVLLCTIGGAIISKGDAIAESFFAGSFIGIILALIGFFISLICWAVWLI